MSGLFGGSKANQASGVTVASGLQIQSSVYGQVLPIAYGTNRIGNNLIWYGNFQAVQQASQGSGGGKGGAGGGGGGKGGGGASGTYNYSASVALSLCEGPIYDVPTAYVNKNITPPESLGFTIFDGIYPQDPWGYLTSNFPDQALGYNGMAYVAVPNYALGTSPQLPNHNFVVAGVLSQSLLMNGEFIPDADASLVLVDLLTNPHYGVGFPPGLIGDLSQLQDFSLASGIWISPFYTSQTQAASMIDDIMTACNCAMVWSNGKLNVYSYGDQEITNPLIQPVGAAEPGVTFTPPAQPLFDLTDDDFLSNSSTTGNAQTSDAVLVTRTRPADAFNSINVEYLDRNNDYNPAIATVQDQAAIDLYGLRQDSVRQFHMFCDANSAQVSAQLQLQRQRVRNQYSFTLDQRYILLDPMDIVSLTDSWLGLNKHWVRIIEITENEDYSLSITAEDYLYGTGTAALNSFQLNSGFSANWNEEPPPPNLPPVLFEPTAQLAEELAVYMALSGPPTWGGCQVWISTDDENYKLGGTISGSNRTGILSAPLASVTPSITPPTWDLTNTLSVDLSQSNSTLTSGSQSDAVNGATLCYVDGEYISYEVATLTGTNQYDLTNLVRGAYDSTIGAHLAGTQFARLDNSIFKYAYAQNLVGQTIYIKFLSFNVYGGGIQSLSEVSPVSYTLQGTAYYSPLDDISNLRAVYVGNILQISWNEIQDFRPILYEIRRGATWNSAQFLARQAHPPFNVPGNGTFWVAAYSNPVAGIVVYSANPLDISVSGAQLVSNVIATFDEASEGWPGELSGDISVIDGQLVSTPGGSGTYTVAEGGFLSLTDFLADENILTVADQIVNIGRVAACGIIMTVASGGANVSDNVLTSTDFLGITDFLDTVAGSFVNVQPQVWISQDGSTGVWQNYTPGFYSGMAFAGRLQIASNNPQVLAIVTDFVFEVDVPDRTDHYMNKSVATTGLTVIFTPDGALAAAPFNGGPNGAVVPLVQVTIMDAVQGDDFFISGLSLSELTITIKNLGVAVARTCSIAVEGF